MRIVFRADASIAIGSGHVMRCMSLATELKGQGAEVAFICNKLPGHLCDMLEQRGFVVHRLQLGPDTAVNWETDAEQSNKILHNLSGPVEWLIVDHYALDFQWENVIRPLVGNLFVIDDLANRRHVCDVLLDQNFVDHFVTRYSALVPSTCKQLVGPKYALLRDEFYKERERSNQKRVPQRILVTFGGSDPSNESGKCLDAVQLFDPNLMTVDLVIGASNPHKSQLEAQCSTLSNVYLHSGINYMAKLMADADIAICAGGTTSLERFSLGLPGIVISIADNQVEIARKTHKTGIDIYLGPSSLVTVPMIEQAIRSLIDNPDKLIESSARASNLVDGLGTKRVASFLLHGTDDVQMLP